MAWLLTARDKQLPPPDLGWRGWWLRSGRGTGKTRVGAEWTVDKARRYPGTRWHIVAATQGDLRVTCFEGESGVLSVVDESELRGGTKSSGYNKTEHTVVFAGQPPHEWDFARFNPDSPEGGFDPTAGIAGKTTAPKSTNLSEPLGRLRSG